MATELAPESAYIFTLMTKMRQGWGSPWRPPSSPLRSEVRPEAQVHCPGDMGRTAGPIWEPQTCWVHGFLGQGLQGSVSTQPDIYQTGRNVPGEEVV